MVILAPENGTRKLLPPDPSPILLTQRQIIAQNADKFRTRAAQQRAFVAAGSGATAGGAGKNTTPVRPPAITKPAAVFPPALPPPPPPVPPPIGKIPKLPPLPPLPPPPLPPSPAQPPGTGNGAVGGGGVAAGGAGILLLIGLALLASFGKR